MDKDSDSQPLPLIEPTPRYRDDRRVRTPLPDASPLSDGADSGEERRRKSDRRATPRLECELGVEERVDGWRFFRTTADVSTFGVATMQGTPYPEGTRLELTLHLEDGQPPLKVGAEVVGIRSVESGGLRLAFRDASADALKRIHRYVVAQRPRPPEE